MIFYNWKRNWKIETKIRKFRKIIVEKRKKDNFFIANNEIFQSLNKPITIFDMVIFNKKFPYILNYFKIVFKNKINFFFKIEDANIQSFSPLFVKRINTWEEALNEWKKYLIKGE